MVARTPSKQRKMLAALNPVLIRETLNKVDRCMARLQELQYTVAGGTKVVSGVSLSPRSTRGYLRTSLRCKQESATRVKVGGASRRSPVGKFPFPANTGEWKRMSLPAMLVGETVGEILQATQFAREVVSAVGNKFASEDPKTPMSQRPNQKASPESNTQLKARRKKEKQTKNDSPPSLQRARSRINFKVSPPKVRELDLQNHRYLANRVSPRNKPWARKTVLFPNPLFLSTNSSSSQPQQQQFCKTRSPIISRNRGTPHKFLIKTPPSNSKFKAKKNKSPPPHMSLSPTRPAGLNKSSPTRNSGTTPHKFLIKSPTLTSKVQAQIKSPRAQSIYSPSRPASFSRSSPTRNRGTPHKFLIKSPTLTSKIQVRSPRTLSISPIRPANLGRNSQKRSAASNFRRSFSPSRIASRLASLSPLKRKKTVQKSDGLFVSGLKQRPASTVRLNTVRRV